MEYLKMRFNDPDIDAEFTLEWYRGKSFNAYNH